VVSNNIRLVIEGEWETAQYDIIDINGRILSVGQVERLNPTITLNSINSGLYVLRVKVAGQQQTIKFTVKR
jgi:aspartate carbamoyltransferase regulatory subunit